MLRGGRNTVNKRRQKAKETQQEKEKEEKEKLKEKKRKEDEEKHKKKKEKEKREKAKLRRARSARGRIQGNGLKERLLAEDWVRSKTDADIPSLRTEQKKKMNEMLIDMYVDDFSHDMGILLVLLRKLEIEEEILEDYQQALLHCETQNVEKTFSQRFDLLGQNRKPSTTEKRRSINLLELFADIKKK